MKYPIVLWAQRADRIFLTIQIEDCEKPQINLEKDKLTFRGKSASISRDADHEEREVTIEFFKPVKVDESKHSVGARGTQFVIIKEESNWWPRLLKNSAKHHWLKVDFPKWRDEDDSEDESGGGMGAEALGGMDPDFFKQFAGGGGLGAGGFGGDAEDDDESEDDETEQKLPDLEEHQ